MGVSGLKSYQQQNLFLIRLDSLRAELAIQCHPALLVADRGVSVGVCPGPSSASRRHVIGDEDHEQGGWNMIQKQSHENFVTEDIATLSSFNFS